MAVVCTSRFSVLKLEDDELFDETGSGTRKGSGQLQKNTIKAAAVPNEAKMKPKKKKKNSTSDIDDLQSLAFGTSKTKGKGQQHHNQGASGKPLSEKQWEEWKKKDDEFVNEAYEQDLQQAILLSKIDYEEKKDIYENSKKDDHRTGCQNLKKKKKNTQKKEKPSAMSLEEFQNLLPSQIDSGICIRGDQAGDSVTPKTQQPIINESNFFEKIEEDAEKIILREQRHEAYKKAEPFLEEQVRSLQHQDEIEKKDKQISYLVDKVEKLKKELKTVKDRNKKLCSILGQGEMREKAEILIQVEHLTAVKDELTEQVSELHAALEQERSKVHVLQTNLKKQQGNKKETKEAK